jgi:hypothetical protein
MSWFFIIVDNFYTLQFIFSDDEELAHYLSCLPTNLLLVSAFVGCVPRAVFCDGHVRGAVFLQANSHLVASSCPQGRPSNFKGPWASKTKGPNDNFLI